MAMTTNPSYGSAGSNGASSQFDQISELIREEFSNSKNNEEALQKINERLGLENYSIMFYGFQGTLANHFSLIKKEDEEELKMRCFALDDSISPVFMPVVEFYKFHEKYNVPTGVLLPVTQDEAMANLRLGEKLHRKDQKFEDSEVDEFDDNCTEECIPGNHKCSKAK